MTVTVGNLLGGAPWPEFWRSPPWWSYLQSPCLQIGDSTDKYPSRCTDTHPHSTRLNPITDSWTCKGYQCPISLHNCSYNSHGYTGDRKHRYFNQNVKYSTLFALSRNLSEKPSTYSMKKCCRTQIRKYILKYWKLYFLLKAKGCWDKE